MEGEKKEVAANAEEADLSQLLDSCLDDFNKPIPKPAPDTVQSSKDAKDSAKPLDAASWNEEFKEFNEAMENIMGGETGMSEIRNLMASLAQEGGPPIDDESFAQSFADTIKDLTEQAQNVPETSPEDLANLLGGLGLSGNPGDPDSIPDIMPMVQNIMHKLMSKEMLYPSIKEIVEKYPGWLAENDSSLKPEELENYKQQYELMKQICVEFEKELDSSEDAEKKQFEKVLVLMQKVQSYGNPPKELVANMPGVPSDVLSNLQIPDVPQQCVIM